MPTPDSPGERPPPIGDDADTSHPSPDAPGAAVDPGPADPTRAPVAPADFDAVYLATRRRLLLEAYALTGDLSAARTAVRDSFVAARHHWRKVGRLPDPEEWVRSRTWATAQRRHVGRLWHRQSGVSAEQKAVLDALHRLPDQQRRALLLTELAGLSASAAGRELGETPERIEALSTTATEAVRGRSEQHDARAALETLAPLVEAVDLPRAELVHRRARRRRRQRALVGTATILALTLLGGFFVLRGGVEDPALAQSAPSTRPVTAAMMLHAPQVQRLSGQQWRLVGTTDNTYGTGINSVCQTRRFADMRGDGTFVRTYTAPATGPDAPRRDLVQTVEISRSPQAAAAAYRTTLGWFAGCRQARLQLLNAYRVTHLGDQARVLKLRIPNAVRRTYVVGVVRTGSLTLSTVLETRNGRQVDVARSVRALSDAVRNICTTDPAGGCPGSVGVAPVLPPRSGETPGTLAAADLPVVGRINRPWVGTRPVRASVNVAATTCDKADFVRNGARQAATRTFLIPQAKVPRRFGITETWGAFGSPARARGFVAKVRASMAACEKKDLGAEVSSELIAPDGFRGSEYALWRLDSEIRKGTRVGFWMGVMRVGRYVAQVNFTPAGADDIDEDTFAALVTRARDRLFELPARPR